MDRPLNVAVIGRQGSGKGTQARLLSERLALTHLSTGDLLRREATGNGSAAEVIRGYLEAGALVPDAVVDGLVARAVREAPAGCVFDGYPRTPAQVDVLDRLVRLDVVIELDLRSSEALARLAARRVCMRCDAIDRAPLGRETITCRSCGGSMVRRHDDHAQAAMRRLDAYDRATAPLLAAYERRGLLVHVDAAQPVDAVAADVLHAVVTTSPSLATSA